LKRLEAGIHNQNDISWIKHECIEKHNELKYRAGYSECHVQTQNCLDGTPWEEN